MTFIIYGIKETPINIEEYLIRCPYCEAHSWADIMVFSKYYHFYWIPIFPIGKEANIFCKKCGYRRIKIPFDSDVISNYDQEKHKFKNPWFTYIGVACMIILFFIIVLALIFESLAKNG